MLLSRSASVSLDVLVFETDGVFLAAAFRIHIPAYNPSKGNQAIDITGLLLAWRNRTLSRGADRVIYDGGEGGRVQARTAHQRSVQFRLRHQGLDVVGFNAAAVKDPACSCG